MRQQASGYDFLRDIIFFLARAQFEVEKKPTKNLLISSLFMIFFPNLVSLFEGTNYKQLVQIQLSSSCYPRFLLLSLYYLFIYLALLSKAATKILCMPCASLLPIFLRQIATSGSAGLLLFCIYLLGSAVQYVES